MQLSVCQGHFSTNHTLNDSALNCSQVSCHLSSCWVSETTAAVVWVPGLAPNPVNQLVLSCPCRDFRITAVASAMAAGIAISQMAVVASTVDPLARRVAPALDIKKTLYNFH